MIFPAPVFHLREPASANFWMKNFLQFFPRGGARKNNSGQFVASQPAVVGNYFFSENVLNFRERGFAGLDEPASDFIRIHDLRTTGAKKSSGGGFAHAHAAG